MLEHRVAREADLAVDAHAGRSRRRADEPRAEIRLVLRDAVEPPEEIEVPPRAPQLAIRDAAHAHSCCFTTMRWISRSSTAASPAASSPPSACRRRAP